MHFLSKVVCCEENMIQEIYLKFFKEASPVLQLKITFFTLVFGKGGNYIALLL